MKNTGTGKWMQIMGGIVFPLILLLYPFRHIVFGLDLMDTGYNYTNFMYMEHMDPMWMFSTYLANVVGAFLMKLPFGGSLMGMNGWTALFVSLLALTGYWFCVKRLKMPAGIAFLGEIVAVSLCWCPTSVLYNYLTYVLFLAGVLLLYQGLSRDKNALLVTAGVCLGANVLVRFSNLPEAGLIVAVWAYGIICRSGFKKVMQQTLWCILGFVAALFVLLGYISLRYGFSEYVEGIVRLFGMTENATDYTATSMLLGVFSAYIENLYWVKRLLVIAVLGALGYAVLPGKLMKLKRVCLLLLMGMTVGWLYYRRLVTFEFTEYHSMLRIGILFLMLGIFCSIVQIFRKNASREDKLLSGLVVLVIFLTSLGSNNKLYPSLNNLFLAGPYVFYMIYRFCKYAAAERVWRLPAVGGRKLTLALYSAPFKGVALVVLFMTLVHSIGFGAVFVFQETHGAKKMTERVDNNEILEGILMHPERAAWMEELSGYVNEKELAGREVILYGQIPAVSYYLQMPPVFNSWPDLRSFSIEAMEEDMQELERSIREGGPYPVVILEKQCQELLSGERQDDKFQLIAAFMEEYGYEMTFFNDKFLLFEAVLQ